MYDKQEWKDEIPDLSRPILDGTGKQKLDPQTGRPLWELVQEGTRITSSRLNHMENGIHSAHEVIDTDKHQNITLQPGIQLVDVPDAAPFRMGEIRGQTRLNILGRAGRCDDIDLWSSWQASKGSGSNFKGLRVTVSDGYDDGAAFIGINNVKKGQSFILVGNAEHNPSAKGARFGATFYAGDKVVDNTAVSSMTSGTYVRQPIHLAFTIPSDVDSITVNLGVVANEDDAQGFFDSIRVHEISSAEYMKLVSMKSEEVAKLYPYYDSMTNVTNPYAIATSGNLLPVLYEHDSMSLNGAKVDLQGAYKGRVVTDKSTQFLGWANISVKPNTTYSIKAERASTITKMYVNEQPAVGIPHTKQHTFNPLQGGTFTTKNDTNVIGVYFGNHDAVGEIAFENPVLSPTTEQQQPFAPQSRSMWAVESQLAADPVDGSNEDVLYVGDDGLPYVLEKWGKEVLAERQQWGFVATYTGFKQVGGQTYKYPITGHLGLVVKHDGKMLTNFVGIPSNADMGTISQNTGEIHITIANKDSGWGDSYTPSNDEIKAYFLGWKMFEWGKDVSGTYNGTGTKGWAVRQDDGTFGNGAHTTVPTTQAPINSQWQPYRLQYLKSKPTTEPVSSYETGLTLSKGWNMIEVGSGIVIREKAKFKVIGDVYQTNEKTNPETHFKYKTNKLIGAYKDSAKDEKYTVWGGENSNGNVRIAYVSANLFDPTAVYHVTYTMLDPTLAAPISGSIAANLRGTVTDMVSWASDAERRLSVVENGDGSHESLDNITPESIGAAKKTDLDVLTKHSVAIKNSASKDLNTYREPGMYFIGALNEYANAPSTDGGFSWGILRVETLGTTAYVAQSYTCVLTNTTFTRSKAEDAAPDRNWMPWRETTKLDVDGVLRLSKWLDIRSDGPAANLYGSTHVYQQFLLKNQRKGYIGVGDPNAPNNINIASDHADLNLFAAGAINLQGRNVLYEIDQLKQSGVNNKQALVDALNAKGIAASTNEDWGTLLSKIQQTTYMRSVQLNHTSEIRASQHTFESVATIPAGVKRIIFTTTDNWATQMYASYDNPTLMFAFRDANGLYQGVSSYYDSYTYKDVILHSFVIDFTINMARASYVVSLKNLYSAETIRISNAGDIQFGLYYFTNGYYNGKGTVNGILQYE
ncbi:pyocin knob domain-containing protein [Paenibacillus alvei]|uniref:pyocin knob domain-containing protein n=1 Tax=Paenibacillus alvei TaxID=44250 RepID=UPI0013DA32DB|nr:pyocin knob domain-containing protein [Paenibacillus alvei]NEZ40256.1 hypothetical protein [Paenibacillus alvei]